MGGAAAAPAPAAPVTAAVRHLAAALSDPDAGAALGLRCLAQFPHLRSVDACLGAAGVRLADPAGAAAAFQRQCRLDYAEGRVRLVDGWLLSEAEVGLFSLLALAAGAAA
jgi:hypothetical protein